MSRIISLQAENVKRLKAVRIEPGPGLTCLGGKNGAGKSSVLDSLLYALAGKDAIPGVPIRRGEESAEIVVTLDSGLTIRRSFTAAGNTYLSVKAKDGAVYSSGQAMLDEMTGRHGFDPVAFLRLDATKQAETLRQLVGLDFTAHNAARKKVYDDRTAVNKRLAEMRASVATLPEHKDAPVTEVSSAEVLKQIEIAQEHNAEQVTLQAALSQATSAAASATAASRNTTTSIATLEKQLAALRKQLEAQVAAQEKAAVAVTEAQDALDGFQPIDTTALKTTLASAEATNAKVRANAQRAKAVEEGKAKAAEAARLTAKLEAMDAEKSAKLAAAQFPVAGLSFSDDAVLFNGLPLDQASSAEQQRVSVAIGAALNPKLRVMIIRDGSLMDDTSLAALRQIAEEMDLQILCERVGTGAECEIVIVDGEVEGAPPVAPITSEKPAASTGRKRATKSTAPATPVASTPADAAPVDDPFALPADAAF
jgi:energy-coupling factor transporter ATP-binding protein EcfA2